MVLLDNEYDFPQDVREAVEEAIIGMMMNYNEAMIFVQRNSSADHETASEAIREMMEGLKIG